MRESPTYHCWRALIQRCSDPNVASFPRYGGRGVTYDPRWSDFAGFLADMGERPEGLSLDRIDNNGPYSRENCRWATARQQANNRQSNRLIEYAGLTHTLAQWARISGLGHKRLRYRLELGWSIERALTESCRTKSGLRHSAVIPMGT